MKNLVLTFTAAALVMIAACTNQSPQEPARVNSPTPLSERVLADDARQERQLVRQDGDLSIARPPAVAGTVAVAKQSVVAEAQSRMATSDFIGYAIEETDREQYMHYDDNGVNVVQENPVSTFSVDVDTASYSNVRRMLMQEGRLPPRDAVRIEELVNYFSYDYPRSKSADQPFSVSMEMAPAPWDHRKHLLQVGLKGYEPDTERRPAANLVFLVDVSGSMQAPNKLELVKRSLKLLVGEMRDDDRIALVVYAGAAGVVLDSTPANQRRRIGRAIDALSAGGSTNGGAGIRLAYDIAAEHYIDDGINRVLIASDGDMNVGTVDMESLKDLVKVRRQAGVSLTTLGFGTGNYNYALMEQLADVGNGNAAYIDGIREAQKVLVDQMQSTLMTIAQDVKIQIEFNPSLVSEYRLIGYENRMLNREDFRNDKVDAGDIGAGHTVTALYEVVLTGSGAERVPALRYQQQPDDYDQRTSGADDEIAFVRLRYKQPGSQTSSESGQAILASMIPNTISRASDNLRFSAAVAGFGQLLRGGRFTNRWDYVDAIELARGARGDDRHGYRSEFVSMVQLADAITPLRTAARFIAE